jgi:pantoate--beta-alanine ligase
MKVYRESKSLQTELTKWQNQNITIGFVPTMGALHSGHIALVEKALSDCDIVVVSIYVNPTQFNNPSDLEKYPRTLDRDADMLEKAGCQIIFAPENEEMYRSDELVHPFEFDFGGLDEVMEGKFRPGHFNGVVQIVSKLFDIVKPDKAYFGEKDFQQLAIIHHMVKVMNYDIQIIGCPIVREATGLALSSRNQRLTPEQHKNAVQISQILFESRNFVAQLSPTELVDWLTEQINRAEGLKLEYFEVVNTTTLQTAKSWNEPSIGCIAVFCGEIRLIDNIKY